MESGFFMKSVGFVKRRSAVVVVASRERDILGREVVLRFGPGQRQPLQRSSELVQTPLAAMKARHRITGHVHLIRFGGQRVHHSIDRLALAAQIFFPMRHEIRIFTDFI